MSELLSNTPTWVFVVFLVLLILGFKQNKTRVVAVKTVFILPIAMLLFSFFGVYSAFGLSLLNLCFWLIGLFVAVVSGLKLAYPKGVSYSAQNRQLTIPGSWVPLMLMMAIFFTKYVVGYAIARQLSIVSDELFITLISLLYGVFSGTFIARSLVMFNKSKISH